MLLPDPRLLRHARDTRGRLVTEAALGLALTGLIAVQAVLVTQLIADTFRAGGAVIIQLLAALALILALRAATAISLRVQARRTAWAVRSRLQSELATQVAGLGPFWFARQSDSAIATLSAHGLDTVEDYLARYLPRLMLAWLVPPLIVMAGLAALAGLQGTKAVLLAVILMIEAALALRAVRHLTWASRNGSTAARQACAILESKPPAVWPGPSAQFGQPPEPTGLAVQHGPRPISLHSVTLCYPGLSRPALADISMTVHPGEHLTITGPADAGKSSLLALLLRFARPTAGVIEYDGHDISLIPGAQWLEQVAWLPQQPHIFAGSVIDNITLARPGSTQETVRRAARLAGADEFIEELADGYQTRLGGGTQLSAAQLRFIDLARAVLRDAPLLLLDEPTAELPAYAAGRLLHILDTTLSGRTVIHVRRDARLANRSGRTLRLSEGRLIQPIPVMPASAPLPPLVIAR